MSLSLDRQQANNDAQAGAIVCYLAEDVDLRTEDDVISFVKLMRWASCFSLRSLRICVGKVGSAAAAVLVSLLSSMEPCARFSHLEFDEEAEAFLASDPVLHEAFASLTTIKILRMKNVGELGAGMLLNMKSSLVFADLWLTRGDAKTPLEDRCTSKPVYLLQRSRHTLETLAASEATTDDNVSLVGLRYHPLKAVTLNSLDAPLMYEFVQAFPNLSELVISSGRFEWDTDMRECTRYRNMNKGHQELYGSWNSLDVVTGTVLDAYAIGLRCPVQRLELSTIGIFQAQRGCVRMMEVVLCDIRPIELRLKAECGRFVDEPRLLSSLNAGGTQRMKTLAITVEICELDRLCDVMEALASLLRELGSVEITTFELVMDCDGLYSNEDEAARIAGYLGELDLRQIARTYIGLIKTVEVVRISMKGHKSRKDTSVMLQNETDSEHRTEDDEAEEEAMEGIDESESSQQVVEMMTAGGDD